MKYILSLLLILALPFGANAAPELNERNELNEFQLPVQKQFKVLSFNTWMLPIPFGIGAKDVRTRFNLIPKKVAESGADIIGLQEVWTHEIRVGLIDRFRELGYPYQAYRGDSFEDGLLIISKFPVSYLPWKLRFSQGTRFDERLLTQKGAIKTRVNIPEYGWIDFYDSHLGAVSYDKKLGRYDPEHAAIRQSQAEELSQWMQQTETSSVQILTVDLNAKREQIFESAEAPLLMPSYLSMVNPAGISLIDTLFNYVKNNGWHEGSPQSTWDKENPYVAAGSFPDLPSEIVDYIFVNQNPHIVPVDSRVVLFERITEEDRAHLGHNRLAKLPKRLSDHYGVLTTFLIK